jgi:hypothetical protein
MITQRAPLVLLVIEPSPSMMPASQATSASDMTRGGGNSCAWQAEQRDAVRVIFPPHRGQGLCPYREL